MKFFLVISIIAFWWVPMNSPGNIGIENLPFPTELLQPKIEKSNTLNVIKESMTKRKMDHFGFHFRKHLINTN
ncbi:MAG: hypothetical protein ACQETL_04630 [Bacteroidota bacterium]